MNEASTIRVYYLERINSIESILGKPRGKFSGQDFHKLRVEIKKVKALSELVYYCSQEFQKDKFPGSFQNIFRKAGKVRELTLEISMLKKLRISSLLKNYVNHLKKQVEKKKRRFFSVAYANQEELYKSSDIILPYFNRIDKAGVNRFLEMKSKEINGLLGTKILKEENAHELRKLLKEFYYTASIFGLKTPWFKQMDDFQELLGKWHDDVVMDGYLQKTLKNGKVNDDEIQTIKAVKQLVSYEGEQLFKQIKLKVTDFQETKRFLDIRL